jgi:hypothetical protein
MKERNNRCTTDEGIREAARESVCLEEIGQRLPVVPVVTYLGWAAARSQERATAHLQAPPYLAFAMAAFAAVAVGSAKAITASPSSKLWPGSPPKP